MRLTIRVRAEQGDVWTQAAADSLVGQTPRMTLNFDWSRPPLARTTVVDARLDDDGSMLLTLDLVEHEPGRVRSLLGPDDPPDVSIGFRPIDYQHNGPTGGRTFGPIEMREFAPRPGPPRFAESRDSFTCPVCGAQSWNPNDVRYGYCGRCHEFTGDRSLTRLLSGPETAQDAADSTESTRKPARTRRWFPQRRSKRPQTREDTP